jgi:hypothetical protein
MHPCPVESLDQRRRLGRGQLHHPVAEARPAEGSVLQSLGDEHQAGPVPQQQLEPVSPLAAEHEHNPREGIALKLLLHQRGKPHHVPFGEAQDRSTGFTATSTLSGPGGIIMRCHVPQTRPAQCDRRLHLQGYAS